MPSPCGNHYGFGYVENNIPSQDGSNSYRPPNRIPPCSPEFSGYGYLGQDDSSQSSNAPKRPPSPKGSPDFPNSRPPAQSHNTNQNINQSNQTNAGNNTTGDNTTKIVVISGLLLLTIIGVVVFSKSDQSKSST